MSLVAWRDGSDISGSASSTLWEASSMSLPSTFYEQWVNLRFEYNRSDGEFHFSLDGETLASFIAPSTEILDASAVYLGSSGYAGGASPRTCWSSLNVYH